MSCGKGVEEDEKIEEYLRQACSGDAAKIMNRD